MMKCMWVLLLLNSSLLSIQSFSQNNHTDSVDKCYINQHPLEKFAYTKMMREHYNFTILGTQTPTSGFKIETTKPTITLKGNVFSDKQKRLLVNLEITGGVQNDILQIFAGDQLNGYFKGSVGFNILFEDGNDAKYVIENDFVGGLTRKKVCEYREEVQKKIDTMLVLKGIEDFIKDPDPNLANIVNYIVTNSRKGEFEIDHYKRYLQQDHYKKLLIEMIKKYGTVAVKTDSIDMAQLDDAIFKSFMKKLKNTTNTQLKSNVILSDINRFSPFFKNRMHKYDIYNDYAIAAYSDIWRSKKISWFNVSLAASNSGFKLYDETTKILSDSTSLLPSLSLTYNLFQKWDRTGKYFYMRAGATIKKVNSIVDLIKFDYNRETVIDTSPTGELKSTKTGTAYIGPFNHGFGFDIPVEVYCSPWKSAAVPGMYGKLQYSYGSSWINKNKISLDLGMVWSVNNNDKDSKNLLTIVPYINWANFLKEYTDNTKSAEKKLSNLFSVGIKFGIPVNLGK